MLYIYFSVYTQSADRYTEEHISVLSQSDFAGQIVNNDHFLYWGEVSKVFDGRSYTFHIIEQTEFIDDVSFMPFKTGHFEPYVKRCSSVKVHSAEKLMYICKDQLGELLQFYLRAYSVLFFSLRLRCFICVFGNMASSCMEGKLCHWCNYCFACFMSNESKKHFNNTPIYVLLLLMLLLSYHRCLRMI